MNKITFENLPSTATPVNATNLNQLQTNVETEINKVNTYATTETKIGTWLGKPLYRKVVSKTVNIGTGQTNVAHGIANVKKVIRVDFVDKNSVYFMPYSFNNTYRTTMITAADATNVTFNSQDSWGSYSFYLIMEYTKTTD